VSVPPGSAARPVYEVRDGGFLATELASGPWDPNAQIGGAPAALLVRTVERLPAADNLRLARMTFEFMRPAPLGPVEVRAEVIRPGRRVQLLEAAMLADDVAVVRARGLRVLAAVGVAGDSSAEAPPCGPDHGAPRELPAVHRPRFATDAVEMRFVAGAFGGGPSTAWFRLTSPVVAGEEPSALQRLAAAADFGAGMSSTLSREQFVFINADMTLYIEREPVGEWICLDSVTRIASGRVGLTESVLYDTRGRLGRATQALLIARR
jgi:Thioesterase-like superfamily